MQLRGCLYGGRKILEGGSSLLTSTIQGHEKTSVEQDKLKIPLHAILLQSATAIFYQVRWLPYYKITSVLQNTTSIIALRSR